MTPLLARSYVYCERLARREAGNFYHAFRLLPGPQRRAMCALYAFMRVADDLADSAKPIDDKRLLLKQWRSRLDAMLAGRYTHRLHAAFHHTMTTYGIPRETIEAVLDGVEMDLDTDRYATFDDLYRYCYRVAAAVGLACIHIWGFSDPKAMIYAESAGIAFQLTNILRDLGEDAARGRIYLPAEDLQRFGYSEVQLSQRERNESFLALMRFEADRVRSHYEAAAPLSGLLKPAGRAVFQVMLQTYRGLLEVIEERKFDVFSGRARVSKWRKLRFVLQALPVRWGWV